MRKLASIREISSIRPIEGADNIELAQIGGWQVVVKKGEFSPGNLCIYCEIDSILPEKPEFEFLRSRNFRIKTMKLRGELSQGICFPTSILNRTDFWIDDDVTEELQITKFEPQIPGNMVGKIKGNFPDFVPKTDEERIQNLASLWYNFPDLDWWYSEKLDGSSHTSLLHPETGEFLVCSRNINLEESDANAFWQIAKTHKLRNKLEKFKEETGISLCLQGEMIGRGIQGNKYKLPELDYYVFNIRNLNENRYLNLDEFEEAILKLDLKSAPKLGQIKLRDYDMKSILKLAEGKSVLNPNTEREGLVFRPFIEQNVNRIGRLSFKAISNKFLLKSED